MKTSVKSFLVTASLVLIGASQASAEVFVWRDADTELSLSYPDTWRQIHNQQPDDIWTVAAPGDNQFASCRMRVREDKRFLVYPRQYSDEVQRLNYSREFWEKYISEFDGAVINGVWDNGALGDGFASFADISFNTSAGPKVQKRGLMFAGGYNDKLNILECSSESQVYDQWYKPFLSIAKSVDFKAEYHMYPNGWYRNFLKDPVLRIQNRKDIDLYTY